MRNADRPHSNTHAAPRGTPGGLPTAAPAAGPSRPPLPRVQPPLQEVLKGLDARELEGQTVFDQLFGPAPEGDPRLSPR